MGGAQNRLTWSTRLALWLCFFDSLRTPRWARRLVGVQAIPAASLDDATLRLSEADTFVAVRFWMLMLAASAVILAAIPTWLLSAMRDVTGPLIEPAFFGVATAAQQAGLSHASAGDFASVIVMAGIVAVGAACAAEGPARRGHPVPDAGRSPGARRHRTAAC